MFNKKTFLQFKIYQPLYDITESSIFLPLKHDINNIKSGTTVTGNGGYIFENDAIKFDGYNKYITIYKSDNILTSDSFTIDFYVNQIAILSSSDSNTQLTPFYSYGSIIGLHDYAYGVKNRIGLLFSDGSNGDWKSKTYKDYYENDLNEWCHYCIVKNINKLYMFVNGKKFIDISISSSLPSKFKYLNVGANWGGANALANYYMRNFRITDKALYTEDFWPPKMDSPMYSW